VHVLRKSRLPRFQEECDLRTKQWVFLYPYFLFTITYIQSTILKAVPEWSVFAAFASLSWCASYISSVEIAWYCSILKDLTPALPFPGATHTNVVRGFKSPLSCDRISVRLWTMASSRWTSTQTHSGLIGAASVNLSRSTTTTCRSFAERWLGGYYRIRDTCGMTCLLCGLFSFPQQFHSFLDQSLIALSCFWPAFVMVRTQIGNPDGEEKPNKKYYDPRACIRSAEESTVKRMEQCFKDLRCVDVLGLGAPESWQHT